MGESRCPGLFKNSPPTHCSAWRRFSGLYLFTDLSVKISDVFALVMLTGITQGSRWCLNCIILWLIWAGILVSLGIVLLPASSSLREASNLLVAV